MQKQIKRKRLALEYKTYKEKLEEDISSHKMGPYNIY
jgi:hypothetical protein